MQTSDPSQPWRRLHPSMILFGLGNILKGWLVPLVFGSYFAYQGSVFLLYFLVITGIFLPAFGLLLRFIGFRYQVGGGNITIREGVFSKKTRRIPVRRIHNINTSQNPVARMLGVVRLDIETAGGGSAEASFVALSYPAARDIQENVRIEKERIMGDTEGPPPPEESERPPIYRIRLRDIFIAGATTNRMGMIFVALAAVFNYLQESTFADRIPDWISDSSQMAGDLGREDPLYLVLLGLAVFSTMFVLAWLISIATALIRWYGFTLRRQDERLNIRTGLLTLREYTIPLEKIQAMQFQTTAIRRPLNLVQIKVQSAGHVGFHDQRRLESDLLVPITHRNACHYFVRSVWPDSDWDGVGWRGVHPFTRTRQFRILATMLLAVVALAHATLDAFALDGWLLPTALVVGVTLSWVISHMTWKQTAYGQDRDFIYIKTGFLGLHFWVIPVSKIQNLALGQSPFQRRRRLASLLLDVAGPDHGKSAVIPNIDVKDAWLLFNRLGHPGRRRI